MKEIKCKTFEEEREEIILSKLLVFYKKDPNNWVSYSDLSNLLSPKEKEILTDLKNNGFIDLRQNQILHIKLTELGAQFTSGKCKDFEKTFKVEDEKIILSNSKLLIFYKENPNNWVSYSDLSIPLSHEERIILEDLVKKKLIFLQHCQVPYLKLTKPDVFDDHLKKLNICRVSDLF